jgi:c-di-GMP-binding flagellar brake protein YcgR
MRQYIRHPLDVKIEIRCSPDHNFVKESTRNISFGGLAFYSENAVAPGSIITLQFTYVQPVFEVAEAQVMWCQKTGSNYLIGVRFPNPDDAFRVRQIEQIYHIESYRKKVELNENRKLTEEEAAKEWIGRYASSFPDP